jgi:hypothetical protein
MHHLVSVWDYLFSLVVQMSLSDNQMTILLQVINQPRTCQWTAVVDLLLDRQSGSMASRITWAAFRPTTPGYLYSRLQDATPQHAAASQAHN